jgi:hypothetical protein
VKLNLKHRKSSFYFECFHNQMNEFEMELEQDEDEK